MPRDNPLKSSTSQVRDQPFTPHGKVDFWIEGHLHLYEATGPFNKELVDCLAVAQSQFLRTVKPTTPWVSICTVKENALATPDGLQRYAELIRTAPAELTPVATAYVIGPEVEGGQFMAPHYEKIFAQAGRPFQTFATMAEAQNWAHAMIDKAERS